METRTKRRLGGGLLFVTGAWFGRETLSWLLGRGLDLASEGFAVVTLGAFPWQNALATLVMLAGALLVLWPGKKSPPEPDPKQVALSRVKGRAQNFVRRVRFHREARHYMIDRLEPPGDIYRELLSIFIDCEKAGLPIPDFQGSSVLNALAGADEFFSTLLPLLRAGQHDEAYAIADTACELAERTEREFNEAHWFVRQ